MCQLFIFHLTCPHSTIPPPPPANILCPSQLHSILPHRTCPNQETVHKPLRFPCHFCSARNTILHELTALPEPGRRPTLPSLDEYLPQEDMLVPVPVESTQYTSSSIAGPSRPPSENPAESHPSTSDPLPRPYTCPVPNCNVSCINVNSLRFHQVHNHRSHFLCPDVNCVEFTVFENGQALDIHKLLHHWEPSSSPEARGEESSTPSIPLNMERIQAQGWYGTDEEGLRALVIAGGVVERGCGATDLVEPTAAGTRDIVELSTSRKSSTDNRGGAYSVMGNMDRRMDRDKAGLRTLILAGLAVPPDKIDLIPGDIIRRPVNSLLTYEVEDVNISGTSQHTAHEQNDDGVGLVQGQGIPGRVSRKRKKPAQTQSTINEAQLGALKPNRRTLPKPKLKCGFMGCGKVYTYEGSFRRHQWVHQGANKSDESQEVHNRQGSERSRLVDGMDEAELDMIVPPGVGESSSESVDRGSDQESGQNESPIPLPEVPAEEPNNLENSSDTSGLSSLEPSLSLTSRFACGVNGCDKTFAHARTLGYHQRNKHMTSLSVTGQRRRRGC